MIDTSREQGIRAITVNPDFWADDPEGVASILAEKTRERPAAVWIIVIGPPGSAERFMDSAFMYGPAEEPLSKEPDSA